MESVIAGETIGGYVYFPREEDRQRYLNSRSPEELETINRYRYIEAPRILAEALVKLKTYEIDCDY